MTRDAHSQRDRQERLTGFEYRMTALTPVLNVLAWVLAMAVRAGLVPRRVLDRPASTPAYGGPRRNRSLRRARASCLRRARRCAVKHGRVDPANFMPRAYAHAGYVAIMPKHYTTGQFYEHYCRDNNLSRAQVYGLSAAHYITAYARGLQAAAVAMIAALLGRGSDCAFSAFGPSDPAPP